MTNYIKILYVNLGLDFWNENLYDDDIFYDDNFKNIQKSLSNYETDYISKANNIYANNIGYQYIIPYSYSCYPQKNYTIFFRQIY